MKLKTITIPHPPALPKGAGVVIVVGSIVVHSEGCRFVTSHDVVNYYNWFLQKEYGYVLHTPRYNAHVSIIFDKFHDWTNKHIRDVKRYTKQLKRVRCNLYIGQARFGGGSKSGKLNFIIPCWSREFDNIRKIARCEDKNYHMTVASNKNLLKTTRSR